MPIKIREKNYKILKHLTHNKLSTMHTTTKSTEKGMRK